jgi:hypothetical protein
MENEPAPPPIEEALPAGAPSNDVSFVDSFQAFLETGSTPAPAAPAPEPAPEPKPVKAKAVKAADPIKALDEAAPQDDPDSMNLPIDNMGEAEEPEADSSEDNPYDKGTPQHRRFAEMRKETGTLKTELEAERQTRAQLESRVKEIEAAAAKAQELEEKIKGYEAKITVTNLTESEAYQEQIAKPLISILERSDAIADRYGIDKDQLAETLEITDEKTRRAAFKELTSGLDIDPDDALEMRALAKEVLPLKARREELLANADKALAELDATKTRAEQEATLRAIEERKETVDKVAKHITTKLPFLKSLEGVNFDELVSSVKESDFNALDTPNKAYSQIAAQLLPQIIRSYDKAIKEVERLSDDIAKYRKQTPRVTPDFGGSPDTGDEEDGLIERYRKQFVG